jgi:two-component system sensor histidine kinase/response regulator
VEELVELVPDLERVAFDLRATVESTVKAFGIRACQKNLELVCHLAPDVPRAVIGDPGRLRLVLLNLVGNAIKFTCSGEVLVRVSRLSEAAGQTALHCSVSDTGIGIGPDKWDAIRGMVEHADNSYARGLGTGMGLAIASQLVTLMGGQMHLESGPGKGSTFYFTVRLMADGPVEEKEARIAALRGTEVLVVDDNATSRIILGKILNNWRMRPVLACGGPTALENLARASETAKPFPLVIIDSVMPGMDGFALLERMRQSSRPAGGSIMMLRSSAEARDAERCRAMGVAASLFKPVAESELLNAVVRALEPKSGKPREGSARVLVVEDNPVNQAVAFGLVEKQGYSPRVVGNGREALAALRKEHFDLVLMDIQMPEMDGIEATLAIRREERESSRHVPIIAMTTLAMHGDRRRCLEAGMDDYISKPIDVHEFATALDRILAREPALCSVSDSS